MTTEAFFDIIQTNKWGVIVKRYSLIATFNDCPIEGIIIKSPIEDIDNFIFQNNINSSNDLFEYINKDGKYEEQYGEFKFEICSVKTPKETLPILYAKDISLIKGRFKEISILRDSYLKKILSNYEFKSAFFRKFVYPYKKTEEGYTNYAFLLWGTDNKYFDIIHYNKIPSEEIEIIKTKYQMAFNKFYYMQTCIKNNKTKKWKYIYDQQRKFYEFYTYFDNQNLNDIYNNVCYTKIDEFEEEMLHDQNPDNYRNMDSTFYEEVADYELNSDSDIKYDFKPKIKKKKINELKNQISMF